MPDSSPVADEATTVLHVEDSPDGEMFVVEEGPIRYLRFGSPDGDNQSSYAPENPASVPMEYVRLATVALAYMAPPESMLMIGLGGGSFTTLLWRLYPQLQIDAVEISPAVWRLAREYFGLPDDPRYRVHFEDGGRFMENVNRRYDLILIDAYTGDDLPAHLATQEYFELTRTRLNQGGVAVLNLAVSWAQETSITRSFVAVFDPVWCYRAKEDTNLVLIGELQSNNSGGDIRLRADKLTSELGIPFNLAAEVDLAIDCAEVLVP